MAKLNFLLISLATIFMVIHLSVLASKGKNLLTASIVNVHFLARAKKTNQKNAPVSRSLQACLRVADPV
jgi:hypothetical protein